MAKIILTDNCVVNFRDDRGGQHHQIGERLDVPNDEATSLVRMGRAKFLDKASDFDKKHASNTATAEDIKQIEAAAAALNGLNGLKPAKGEKAA